MYRFIAPNNNNKNEMGKGLVVTPFWAKEKQKKILILLIPENSKMIIIGPA